MCSFVLVKRYFPVPTSEVIGCVRGWKREWAVSTSSACSGASHGRSRDAQGPIGSAQGPITATWSSFALGCMAVRPGTNTCQGNTMSLDAAWALDWARRAALLATENRAQLTELDRAIGDADHGDNLDRGMRAVVTKLDAAQETGNLPATPGGVLKVVATTLMATVGGAGGPLLGTAFLKAARSSDASAWGTQELVRALEEATSGLEARGHATSGDKTMADAWRPAAVAAREAAEIGEDEIGVLAAAAQAAAKGARDTEPLQARRGRASFLGERSCGHRDPGAQSSALILQAAADAARDHSSDPFLVVEQA